MRLTLPNQVSPLHSWGTSGGNIWKINSAPSKNTIRHSGLGAQTQRVVWQSKGWNKISFHWNIIWLILLTNLLVQWVLSWMSLWVDTKIWNSKKEKRNLIFTLKPINRTLCWEIRDWLWMKIKMKAAFSTENDHQLINLRIQMWSQKHVGN